MPRQLQYVSINRIFSKIYRDLGLEEVSETDLVEWSAEALEAIGAVSMYEQSVCIQEVVDHKAVLPKGLHSIIQIARHNNYSKINIVKELDTEVENPCGPNSLLDDIENVYIRTNISERILFKLLSGSNSYRNNFTPVRLSNHTFFNSVVCEEDASLYHSCTDEYTIGQDCIVTSFKEGHIVISYNKQMVDEQTGYPMIPDDYSIITAITMYITMKYMGRLWYLGREGFTDKYQKAEQDWQWYCKQAGNQQMTMYGIDEHENYKDQKNRLVPNNNSYYGFFGSLNKPENTNFKKR